MRELHLDFVYLLHFHTPISPKHTCQHYMGSAEDLIKRLGQHLSGRGSSLCQVAIERGVTWELARVWQAPDGQGRALEKRLKAQHNGKKLCPICAQGGERVIGEDVNFYAMPLDLVQALDEFALGVRYCPERPPGYWEAVEEDKIGD